MAYESIDDAGGSTDASPPPIADHLLTYSKYLRSVPKLTAQQQIELHTISQDLKQASDIRNWALQRLWLDTCKLVLYVLRLLYDSGNARLNDMDAIQAANLAAGIALPFWKPDTGALSTFLVPRIRGALLNHLTQETRIESPLTVSMGEEEVSSDDVIESLVEYDDDDPKFTVEELLVYDRHVFDDPELVTEYGQVRRLLVERHGQGWGDLAADFLIGDTNVRDLAVKYAVSVPTIYARMRKMGF